MAGSDRLAAQLPAEHLCSVRNTSARMQSPIRLADVELWFSARAKEGSVMSHGRLVEVIHIFYNGRKLFF